MSTPKSVLGVLALCRLDFATLHTYSPVTTRVLGECVRCVRFKRVRARVRKKIARCITYLTALNPSKISLREALKTLHTLHTLHGCSKAFVFIEVLVCWVCVGLAVFVLGCGFGGRDGQ